MRVSMLLVHGANHDGWCWTPVLERLDRVGVRARTLDLPLTSYADDADTVRTAVSQLDEPVVLVAHSYGGLPVVAGGHQASRLVFVAARMPALGESPAASTPHWGYPEYRESWTLRADGAFNLTADAVPVLYSASPPNLVDQAVAHWRWTHSAVPSEPFHQLASQQIPSCYVVCTQDRTVQVAAQRACAARAEEWIELDCDHCPFFSAPDALARVLSRQAAAAEAALDRV